MTKSNTPHGLALLVASLALLAGCHSSETSRDEMNPRKEAIYKYAYSLAEEDKDSSVMSSGLGVAGRDHPVRLTAPYPTQAEVEAAIGKADFSDVETPPPLEAPHYEGGPMLTLYWWEKDSTWEVPGLHKKGVREIVIARFDKDGRLWMLEILRPVGFESIGRSSYEWNFISD